MKNNRVSAWAYDRNAIAADTTQDWVASKHKIHGDDIPCEIVFNGGWIHVSERKPTKRDADKHGHVLVWVDSQDIWAFMNYDRVDQEYWQPCPAKPKKVDNKRRL